MKVKLLELSLVMNYASIDQGNDENYTKSRCLKRNFVQVAAKEMWHCFSLSLWKDFSFSVIYFWMRMRIDEEEEHETGSKRMLTFVSHTIMNKQQKRSLLEAQRKARLENRCLTEWTNEWRRNFVCFRTDEMKKIVINGSAKKWVDDSLLPIYKLV